jgi:hypothetical protein
VQSVENGLGSVLVVFYPCKPGFDRGMINKIWDGGKENASAAVVKEKPFVLW